MASDFPSLRSRQPRPAPSGGFRMPAVRLLPIVIVAAVCMLGFRLEVVVENIASARKASVQVTPSVALAQGEKATEKPAKPAEKPADGAAQKAEGEAAGAEGATAEAGGKPGFNASALTKSEIETLQRLSERREQIEKREKEITDREALQKAAEARIDGKVAQLQDLEKTIQGLLQKYDKQKVAEIEQLVKIYGAMKPKDAAGIFDTLDMPVLLAVVQAMKEAKVAPILSQMSRDKARLLTEELSQRKQVGG